MQLEDYFEFEMLDTKHGVAERIRIKGHRISIENLIEPYNAGVAPEVIARDYHPSLTLEQVYATITYYLHNKTVVDAYIERGEKVADAYYQEYLQKGPYFLKEGLEPPNTRTSGWRRLTGSSPNFEKKVGSEIVHGCLDRFHRRLSLRRGAYRRVALPQQGLWRTGS